MLNNVKSIQGIYWMSEKEKESLMKKLDYDGKTMLQVHEKRRCDGKYYVWSDWIRALLRDGMYTAKGNKPKTLAMNHMKIFDSEIHTNGMGVVQTHVSVGNRGGISRFEAIMPNAWAEINLKYPSNLINEDELDQILTTMGNSKGFGANHSRGFGKFEIETIE